MKRTAIIHLCALMASVVVAGDSLAAQRDQPDLAALRTSIERRFEVMQIRDGVVLKPRGRRAARSQSRSPTTSSRLTGSRRRVPSCDRSSVPRMRILSDSSRI